MIQIITTLGFCIFFFSCVPHVPSSTTSSSSVSSSLPVERLVLEGPDGERVSVMIEIAFTDADRARGLMERTALAEDHGMLFVFDRPQNLSFWMKNTKIPLDILFFDQQGHFVSKQHMTPCKKDPCNVYASSGPAQYALEVNAGFAKSHGIQEGWGIDYVRDGPE